MAAITSLIAIASIGLTAASTFMSMEASKKQQEASQAGIAAQQRAEEARSKQMELDAQRRAREVIRQQQRARSAAITNATAQGAQFGSGLSGGYGQIGGQTGFNLLGIGQNLQLGRDIFAANADLSQARMQMASAQGDMAFASGLSSLGGAMMRGMGTFSNIFSGMPYEQRYGVTKMSKQF